MTFDTNISLDLVFTILAILGAVWRIQHVLENRYNSLRKELKTDHMDLRSELKADNEALRTEFKSDVQDLKAENAELREDIRRVEDKVDESNQRIARLEGIILAREGMVDTIIE